MGAIKIYCEKCRCDVTENFIQEFASPWFDLGKILEVCLFSDVYCPDCAPGRRRGCFEIFEGGQPD